MTLEQIKNEITASLKEVRESSRDFSGCESYDDLQSLFKKAIGRIALCESGEDIEAVGDLLMAIEELYNDCNSEFLNQPSDIELFSFDFELDEEQTDSEKDDEEENESEDEMTEDDEEEEDYSEESEPDNVSKSKKAKSESKKNNSSKEKGKRKSEGKEDKDNSREDTSESKSAFDKKYPVSKLRKPNIMRLCVGCIALLSGICFGLVDALWWPWEWYAWSMIGFGISYLILCVIYSIAIASRSRKAVRVMAVTRLTLAFIMLAVSLALGLMLPYDLTVGGAFIATVPFTVFGILTYFIYRIRLSFAQKASNKEKAKKKKN